MKNFIRNSKVLRRVYERVSQRAVPIEKVLAGADNGINPAGFSLVSGNLLWTSTKLSDTPMCEFFREYQRVGEEIFKKENFEGTSFYKHACCYIKIIGRYLGENYYEGIREKAKELVEKFKRIDQGEAAKISFPVRRIEDSDCYQLAGDHLLVAALICNGAKELRVQVARSTARTALQQQLENVLWFGGNKALYQPVNAPELKKSWPLLRKCTDRWKKMKGFLKEHKGGVYWNKKERYVDLGSFYGWFVGQMKAAGFDAHGIEMDPLAIQVGVGCYGVDESKVLQGDVAMVLDKCEPFEILSCLSVLHHFVAGTQSVSADELIKLLDKKTQHVMFLDTGQEHEACVQGALPGWTPDFIEKWILERTSFTTAHRLGIDEDAVPPNVGSYGRMLFAFTKD